MEKRILIISDDPVLLEFLQHHLKEGGYQVAKTEDVGDQLQAVLEEKSPDLIILDAMMPWLEGIEIALRLRRWCQTPILMLSTWRAGKDQVRALDLEAPEYLSEPFNAGGLLQRLGEILSSNSGTRSPPSAN